MKLHIFIFMTASYCPVLVISQSRGTVNQKNPTATRDQIYFADNRPKGNTKVEVQKSQEEDSYTQASSRNQYVPGFDNVGTSASVDGSTSRLPPLSENLQPPQLDGNSQNYYSAYHDNLSIGKDVQEQVPPVKPLESSNASSSLIGFGINLLKSLAKGTDNVVLSPFSIAELLALLQQGALSVTQQQINNALQMSPHRSLETFKNINERFHKRGNSHNVLEVANNLFVSDTFELSPTFKNIAISSFNSEVTPTKFSGSSETVQRMNQWVAQKTKNKILDLLSPDAVGENTQMVMVNAVYFKGLWAVRFKPESTLPRDFYVNEDAKKTIPFMRLRKIFKAGVDPGNNAKVINLPFENEQYSLMVVLPSSVSTLEGLISQLTVEQLESYRELTPKEVDFEIPKFTIKVDTNLNPVFRKMGITNVFTNQADLSGLGKFGTYSPQLSSALHTAMLSIDEEGGSAAAATSFAVVALSYDDTALAFRVNRPFLAVLWDNESAIPLFMARVQNPASTF